MARRIGRLGKKAYKFNYELKIHSITLEVAHVNFCPRQLSLSFTRRGKRLHTKFVKWEASISTPCRGVVIFPEPENLKSIVTLYRGQRDNNYEKKEWDIAVIELTRTGKRKVMGKNSINMVDFMGDASGVSQDLLVKLKPTSKKIKLIEVDANLFSRFEKSGNSNDFDMKSLTSMMSISQLSCISDLDDNDLDDLDIDLKNLDENAFDDEITIERISPKMFSPPNFINTDNLLHWCQEATEGYPSVSVRNFTTCWRNGLAFAAIIHKFHPNLIDFDSLNPQDVIRNCKISFDIGASLGVPKIIKPEQMDQWLVPDRLAVTAYVYQLYIKFDPTVHEHIESHEVTLLEANMDKSLIPPELIVDSPNVELAPDYRFDTETNNYNLTNEEMSFQRSISVDRSYEEEEGALKKREKVQFRSVRRLHSEDPPQKTENVLNEDTKRRVHEFLNGHGPKEKSLTDRANKQELLRIQAKELLNGRTSPNALRRSNRNSPIAGRKSAPTPSKFQIAQNGNNSSDSNTDKERDANAKKPVCLTTSLELQFRDAVGNDQFDLADNSLFKIANNAFSEDQSSASFNNKETVPIETLVNTNVKSDEPLPIELIKLVSLSNNTDQNTISREQTELEHNNEQPYEKEFIASSYKTLSSTESNVTSDANSVSSPETKKLIKRLTTNKIKSEKNYIPENHQDNNNTQPDIQPFLDSSLTKVPPDVSDSPQASPPRLLTSFKKGFRSSLSKTGLKSLTMSNNSKEEYAKQMDDSKKLEKKARIKSKRRNQRVRKAPVKPTSTEPTLILKKVVSANALDDLPDDSNIFQPFEEFNSAVNSLNLDNKEDSYNEYNCSLSPSRHPLTSSLPNLDDLLNNDYNSGDNNSENDNPKINLQNSDVEARVLCFENLSPNSSSSSDRLMDSYDNYKTTHLSGHEPVSKKQPFLPEYSKNDKNARDNEKSTETDYLAHNLKKLCTMQISLEANLKSLDEQIRMNEKNEVLDQQLATKRYKVVDQQIFCDNRHFELITISETKDLEVKEQLLRKEYENKIKIDVSLKSKEQLWEEEILWKDIQELLEKRRDEEDKINQIILKTTASDATNSKNNVRKPANSNVYVSKKQDRGKAEGSSWGELFGKIYNNLV